MLRYDFRFLSEDTKHARPGVPLAHMGGRGPALLLAGVEALLSGLRGAESAVTFLQAALEFSFSSRSLCFRKKLDRLLRLHFPGSSPSTPISSPPSEPRPRSPARPHLCERAGREERAHRGVLELMGRLKACHPRVGFPTLGTFVTVALQSERKGSGRRAPGGLVTFDDLDNGCHVAWICESPRGNRKVI